MITKLEKLLLALAMFGCEGPKNKTKNTSSPTGNTEAKTNENTSQEPTVPPTKPPVAPLPPKAPSPIGQQGAPQKFNGAKRLEELHGWGSEEMEKDIKAVFAEREVQTALRSIKIDKSGISYPKDDEINKKIAIWFDGDSTKLAADAIVNAANEYLHDGGGICGAIFRAADGRKLAEACAEAKKKKNVDRISTGDAVVTDSCGLPAKYIIHAVGPNLASTGNPTNNERALLEKAYQSILNLAVATGIKSVGLCCISAALFGYPPEKAARVALNTVRIWLQDKNNRDKVEKIVFVLSDLDPKSKASYATLAPLYFPTT